MDLPEGEYGLYPGMFVKVAFVTGRDRRLVVPLTAVAYRSEVRAVYVVKDGDVALRQVRLGRTFGDMVEILAGVDPGEAVALNPVAAAVQLKSAQAEPQR